MNSFQIQLCSTNADIKLNNNISDCLFYLPQLGIPNNYRILISVQNATIPYTFYQVNKMNNILRYYQYTPNNTVIEVYKVIPVGNYTIDELISQMNKLMEAHIVSYDYITGKTKFTSTVNQEFSFVSEGSTCFELLGFDKKTFYTSTNKILISPYPANVLFTNCLCIYSNIKTDSFNQANMNDKKLLCTIPITVEPYSLITYQNTNVLYRSNTYTNNINQIEIRICDMCGDLVDLNNNNWSLTLQFDLLDFVEKE